MLESTHTNNNDRERHTKEPFRFLNKNTFKKRIYLMSENTQKTAKQGLPSLAKSTIWMLSFGYLGVQTAFTLQSSQMSRIFQTLGADP
ncbi:hypothetical protein ACTHTV_03565, partial [Neisseria sp. P0015.S010]